MEYRRGLTWTSVSAVRVDGEGLLLRLLLGRGHTEKDEDHKLRRERSPLVADSFERYRETS